MILKRVSFDETAPDVCSETISHPVNFLFRRCLLIMLKNSMIGQERLHLSWYNGRQCGLSWVWSKCSQDEIFLTFIAAHLSFWIGYIRNWSTCYFFIASGKLWYHENWSFDYVVRAASHHLFTSAIPLLHSAGTFACCVSALGRYVPHYPTW